MESQKNDYDTYEQNGYSQPPLVETEAKNTHKYSNNDTNEPAKVFNWRNIVKHYNLILTGVLVVANMFLAYANWQLAKDSNRQVQTAMQMVEETRKYVAIAEKSNDIQQQNMFASNTPYISISTTNIRIMLENGGFIKGVIHYVNTGKTPAINFKSLPIIRFQGKYATYTPDAPIKDDYPTGKPILMPQDRFSDPFESHALNDTDVFNIKNRIWDVYLCSVVNYQDVFGHRFQVTQRLHWDGNGFYPDIKGNEYKQLD